MHIPSINPTWTLTKQNIKQIKEKKKRIVGFSSEISIIFVELNSDMSYFRGSKIKIKIKLSSNYSRTGKTNSNVLDYRYKERS